MICICLAFKGAAVCLLPAVLCMAPIGAGCALDRHGVGLAFLLLRMYNEGEDVHTADTVQGKKDVQNVQHFN